MDVPERQIAAGESGLAQSSESLDAPRRTWLAAERTWLAWWRTALGGAAVAMAVGRFLPTVAGGSRWPYGLVGIGYALIAIAVLMTALAPKENFRSAEARRLFGTSRVCGGCAHRKRARARGCDLGNRGGELVVRAKGDSNSPQQKPPAMAALRSRRRRRWHGSVDSRVRGGTQATPACLWTP